MGMAVGGALPHPVDGDLRGRDAVAVFAGYTDQHRGRGLEIFESGYPLSRPVSCPTGAVSDSIEKLVKGSGSSRLVYDALTGEYTCVWKTTKGWTGWRELVLRFDDGTEVIALFQLK
jgi:hypothetical protein